MAELTLHHRNEPPRKVHRRAHWNAAILSGLVSGVAFIVILSVVGSIVYDDGVWTPFHRIASLVIGPSALDDVEAFDSRIVTAALGLHLGLSMLYGLAFATLVRGTPETALWIGAMSGVILYGVNFYLFTLAFPWMAVMREPVTLMAHAVFGGLVAASYWALREEHPEGALAGP